MVFVKNVPSYSINYDNPGHLLLHLVRRCAITKHGSKMPNNKKNESEFANSDISRTAQHNLLSDIRPRKSIKELQQDSSLMSEVDEIQNESQMSAGMRP